MSDSTPHTLLPRKLADVTAAEAVAAIAGGLALFVTLVYVLGGFTLAWRLTIQGLPAETVVGGLPREFLVTVGLGVTFQLLIFLGVMSLALVRAPILVWKKRLWVVSFFAAAALAWPLVRSFLGSGWRFLVVLAAVVTWLFLVWVTRWIVTKVRGETRIKLAGWLLLAFLAVFFLWRGALEFQATRVLDAKVCTTGGDDLSGLFIGENDNSVYLGEKRGSEGFLVAEEPRVAAVRRESVEVLFIGPDAQEATCPLVGESNGE